MTILVLVLAAGSGPYPLLARVIGETWAAANVAGTEILFYRGGAATSDRGGELVLPVPDDLGNVALKTLAAFEHVLATRTFDLLFRTNCSSYVDLENLSRFASLHARELGFYAGVVGRDRGVPFASGSGYFLSRDLVEIAAGSGEAWDRRRLDDVALGALLAERGVEPETMPRVDLRCVADVAGADLSQFHFRCRTDSWRRLGDARIMLALNRLFCAARGTSPRPAVRAAGALETVGRLTRRIAPGVRGR